MNFNKNAFHFYQFKNVSVGGLCHHSKECVGSEHSKTCKNSRCTCSNEYILIDLKCEQGMLFTIYIRW